MFIKGKVSVDDFVDSLGHAYHLALTVFDWHGQDTLSLVAHLHVNLGIKPGVLK